MFVFIVQVYPPQKPKAPKAKAMPVAPKVLRDSVLFMFLVFSFMKWRNFVKHDFFVEGIFKLEGSFIGEGGDSCWWQIVTLFWAMKSGPLKFHTNGIKYICKPELEGVRFHDPVQLMWKFGNGWFRFGSFFGVLDLLHHFCSTIFSGHIIPLGDLERRQKRQSVDTRLQVLNCRCHWFDLLVAGYQTTVSKVRWTNNHNYNNYYYHHHHYSYDDYYY